MNFRSTLALFCLLQLPTSAFAHGNHKASAHLEKASVSTATDCHCNTFSTGRIVDVNLDIAEQTLAPAGKPVRSLTINGTVPGPTLRFYEGDTARIHVHNSLSHEETSLHWHGLLVPNDQDGVPHLTTPPIAPGTTLTYEFTLRQSGTYWFHSHTGLQEQRGALGSIVVAPRNGEPIKTDREQVLVLTDWTNEHPNEVLRTLKRNSNWYAIKKGTAQSITGAIQAGELSNYFKREKTRMPPMDLSDVAYDAFLINGQRQFQVNGLPGETVRLRVVNGSAATYFYLESATGPLSIVAADGPSVQPTDIQRLLIGIAETYDLVVKIPATGSWEIRATSQDGSGNASAFIGQGPAHAAPDVPRPNLYNMDSMLMSALDDADSPMVDSPSMHKAAPTTTPTSKEKTTPMIGSSSSERPLSPYRALRALHPTTLPTNLPRRTVTLHLTGDMQRYIWSFDGKTIDEESLIPVKRGEVLQMELVNDTMMHHPIHLHGHFFRLLNGQGAFSPLKHTVDVPPMSRRILEFEANETGDWMFHCHILYHMMEGMARVLHYQQENPPQNISEATPSPHLGEHAMPMRHAFADFNVLGNLSEGTARVMSGRDSLVVPWEVGKKRGHGPTEYEGDILYERYITPNFGAIGGIRLSNQHPGGNRPVAGAWYRLPHLVTATGTVDAQGALRMALTKDFQITPRLNVNLRSQYDTRQRWEQAISTSYTLTKSLSLSAAYHTDYGLGAGLSFHF